MAPLIEIWGHEVKPAGLREIHLRCGNDLEWAIDISSAKFRLLEITGIPAKCIIRDPRTQKIVTRERALNTE